MEALYPTPGACNPRVTTPPSACNGGRKVGELWTPATLLGLELYTNIVQ